MLTRAPQRCFFRIGLCATALALYAAGAAATKAAGFPERPIRMVVPFTPGGGTDIIARALAQHLNGAWSQNVIVDNRAGGNTVIGSDIVANARPDGHTLIMQINTLTALPAMPKAERGTFSLDQFAPVSLVAALPHLLVVHRAVPAANIKELVALAKAQPGKFNYSSSGIGTPVHLAAAWFASMAGIDLVHVPYKGAPEYTAAVLGGHVQMVFGSVPLTMPHVRSGALKALGVTTAKRVAPLPDLPTIAESGYPGFDIMSWYGVLAPARTPAEVVSKLATEIATATKTKKFADLLPDYQLIGNTPTEFAAFLRKDAEVSAKIISQSGAKSN